MITLEARLICASKVRVMQNIVYTEPEFWCRACQDNSKDCFRPYSPQAQIPIRTGIVAFNLQSGYNSGGNNGN